MSPPKQSSDDRQACEWALICEWAPPPSDAAPAVSARPSGPPRCTSLLGPSALHPDLTCPRSTSACNQVWRRKGCQKHHIAPCGKNSGYDAVKQASVGRVHNQVHYHASDQIAHLLSVALAALTVAFV